MLNFRTNRYDSRMNFLVNALVACPAASQGIFSNLHQTFANKKWKEALEENRHFDETIDELLADEQLFRGCVGRMEQSFKTEFGGDKPAECKTEFATLDRLIALANHLMQSTTSDPSERELDGLAGKYLSRMIRTMDIRQSRFRYG